MTKENLHLSGFVEAVQSDSIMITVEDHSLAPQLEEIGFVPSCTGTYRIMVSNDELVAKIFIELRDMGFAFSAGPGWSPSQLFERFRETGLLSGEFLEVYWTGPGSRQTRIL